MPSASAGGAGAFSCAKAPRERRAKTAATLAMFIKAAPEYYTIYAWPGIPLSPLYTPAKKARFFAFRIRRRPPPRVHRAGSGYWLRRTAAHILIVVDGNSGNRPGRYRVIHHAFRGQGVEVQGLQRGFHLHLEAAGTSREARPAQ